MNKIKNANNKALTDFRGLSKKAYPNCKVTRDYSGQMGDIVVGRYTEQYWGRGV